MTTYTYPTEGLEDGLDAQISIAGLLLARQMPGSAKGVMFITLEDESANANLIVWSSVFERNRRTILSASMMGCQGKVQHESGVIHLIVEHVSDLSSELKCASTKARISAEAGQLYWIDLARRGSQRLY